MKSKFEKKKLSKNEIERERDRERAQNLIKKISELIFKAHFDHEKHKCLHHHHHSL